MALTQNEQQDEQQDRQQDRQQDHTNFILLGFPRCGSNLLLRALTEHPQIRIAGEILSDNESIRKAGWDRVNKHAWPQPRGEGYQIGQDGGEFLRTRVFSDSHVENIRAFGFKFFYEHAHFDSRVATAWDYVAANRDIKIIHLIRRNLLYALISKEVAARTDLWYHLIEEGQTERPPLPPFALSTAVCKQYFDQITGWRQQADQRFAGHHILHVEYETELCNDFRKTTFCVFDFLGTLKWYLKPGLVKQQTLTAAQQITNFHQLQQHFRDTPYAEFFAAAASPDSIAPARLTAGA